MALSACIFAQEYNVPTPSMLEDPMAAEREPDHKKSGEEVMASAYATSYNGSYYSDYYIYFKFSGLSFGCDCSNGKYQVTITYDGSSHNLGTVSGTSYSGLALDKAVGPSQYKAYSYRCNEGGSDDKVLGICWTSCGRYWYNTGTVYFSTASIRNPKPKYVSNGEFDYRIDLQWYEDTDIPASLQGYVIKRDGVEIGRVYNGATSYSDQGVGPNETHTYTIQTMYPDNAPTHYSYGITMVGRTFDLGLEATTDLDDAIHLTWNNATGKGKAALSEYILKRYDPEEDISFTISDYISSGTTDYPDESETLIPGYMYKYTLQPLPEASFYSDTAWGKSDPDGELAGKVISPSGIGVSNVKICAKRLTEVPQDTTSLYCTVTDSSGDFTLRDMYYYKEAEFRLFAEKENHGFDPAFRDHIIHQDDPPFGGIVFTDTSAVTLTGKIIQIFAGDTCPVPNVEIYLDTNTQAEITTDENGMYAFSVGQIGEYTITPKLDQHHFNPSEMTYNVASDTVLETFKDTTLFILSGYVTASCETYIGRAKLMIASGTAPDYCLDTVIMTETLTGYYEIELPAREYSVTLVQFFSEHAEAANADVETYFPAKTGDLTFGDQQVDFIYRSEPQLEISGFLDYGCGDYADVPIIEQGYEYMITFEVNDVFGGNSCPADTGQIIVQNNLARESNQVDTLQISAGMADYYFNAGGPNLIAPHLKNMSVTAYVGKEFINESIDVLVEGNRAREQTFATVSPEIPFMILRDPPGDASYSYLEENTTTETALRFSGQVSGSVNVWAEIKLGTKFELGIFGSSVETEIWGKVRGSLEVGASLSGQEEFTMKITNGENFKTSGNQDVTGESGDVFAGSAMNMIYALTDVVRYDPETCTIKKTVSLIMGVDDFATTFLYTEDHIRNVLIPQLAYLRDYYEAEDNDSSAIYANQIDVWQQTLKLNTDLKQRSVLLDNYSFSSGTSYENFQEVSTTASASIEFSMYIEAGIAIEAGIEVAGVGGSAGIEAKFRAQLGESRTSSKSFTRKTGFYFDDDDGGDFFSVDVLADHVFGTPVFKTVSGNSSCPWEPGTLPREDLSLTSDSYVEFVDDPAGQAVFQLSLGNISQSDEDRTYNLVFDQASNPDGAVLTLGGSQVQGGILTPYHIPAGESKLATVTVERGPVAFDYQNLQFTMLSGCGDGSIRDTVLLDVHFKSECSELTLTRPGENWLVTSADNDLLNVVIGDYDRELLDFVRLEVANAGVNNWLAVSFIDKEDLDPGTTTHPLMLAEFADGEYELRAMAECSSGRVYSDIIKGRIDRKAPQLYGLPEPSDLVLDEGDRIMAVFNEEISCYKLTASKLVVTNLSTDETVDAAIGCSGNTLLVIPYLSGDFEGDTFNVAVRGIEDLYGNAREDTVSWTFVITADPAPSVNEDTDNDGIINLSDNCPYSANAGQEDMDTDGTGDVCDEDVDGDDVLNLVDNCLLTANPEQTDANEDGIGDACQDFTGIQERVAGTGYWFFENYPNPFADKTTLKYVIPYESRIIMRVFDVTGQEVATLMNREMPQGTHTLTWDAGDFRNGIYFCTIYAESLNTNDMAWKTIKMVIAR